MNTQSNQNTAAFSNLLATQNQKPLYDGKQTGLFDLSFFDFKLIELQDLRDTPLFESKTAQSCFMVDKIYSNQTRYKYHCAFSQSEHDITQLEGIDDARFTKAVEGFEKLLNQFLAAMLDACKVDQYYDYGQLKSLSESFKEAQSLVKICDNAGLLGQQVRTELRRLAKYCKTNSHSLLPTIKFHAIDQCTEEDEEIDRLRTDLESKRNGIYQENQQNAFSSLSNQKFNSPATQNQSLLKDPKHCQNQVSGSDRPIMRDMHQNPHRNQANLQAFTSSAGQDFEQLFDQGVDDFDDFTSYETTKEDASFGKTSGQRPQPHHVTEETIVIKRSMNDTMKEYIEQFQKAHDASQENINLIKLYMKAVDVPNPMPDGLVYVADEALRQVSDANSGMVEFARQTQQYLIVKEQQRDSNNQDNQ